MENGVIVEELRNHRVQVGDVEVVQGVDMVLSLMRVGELAEVTADARFAYGTHGLKNDTNPEKSIPPNAKVSIMAYLRLERRLIYTLILQTDYLRSGIVRLQ